MRKQSKKQHLSHFPVADIKTAKENDLIYDRFGLANDDDHQLMQSIGEHGIQEPLVISTDCVLLSGHRRLGVAKRLGIKHVPVRQVDINFGLLSTQERMSQLIVFNQQRDKSKGERIREKLVEIDPKEARSKLVKRRIENHFRLGGSAVNVQLGPCRKRAKITTKLFLLAVMKIVEENKPYWPMTDRRIHYLLLNDPPLRHDKKLGSKYVNDKASYKALTNLLTRARLTQDIPMIAIEDSTRPVQLGGGFDSLEGFVAQETDNFLTSYSRNLMQGQPHHLEILLEKNALRSVIEKTAAEYCIPITTGRGYSSLAPRHELVQRYRASGKQKLVVLMLTDFDPDGEQIASSFARSLRDDFGVSMVYPVKVALTAEDVAKYNLPSDMDAKPSSPNYKRFNHMYGTKAVELDAAPLDLLQNKLRDAIESWLDMDEFHAQVQREEEDAAHLEAHRQVAIEAIRILK